ncbi:MAG: hypothetical protein ACTHKG_03530 [Nocardioides sp.]
MRLDQRLREGTQRATDGLAPDVERHLHQAMRRGRRRVVHRRIAGTVSVAAAVVAVAVVAPRVPGTLRDAPRPLDQPDRPAPTARVLTGTATTVLSPAPGPVDDYGMAGRWTLQLDAAGAAELTAPASFQGSTDSVAFQADGSRFRTNAFVNDLCGEMPAGTYRLTRDQDTWTFAVVDDDCDVRVALLTSRPWRERPGG